MAQPFCPRCGAAQDKGNLFCPKCGHQLSPDEAPAQEASESPEEKPERYSERALKSGAEEEMMPRHLLLEASCSDAKPVDVSRNPELR